MEQLIIKQLNFSEIIQDIDVIICASGYESRASFLADSLGTNAVKFKYVLSFKDQKDIPTRIKNDKIFRSHGYQFIENEKDNYDFIRTLLPLINNITKENSINILIDYSSMTRTWFAAIVNSFHHFTKNVKLIFSYSVAKFSEPNPSYSPSIKFDPIPGFNNLSIPDKPTALIIGLGYEKDRAAGLIEYFDADEVFAFVTDNLKYKPFLYAANKTLLKQIKPDNIIPYPMNDIMFTYKILTNLCLDLASNYRIIITPSGPKPFSLLSFICGIQLRFIDIWRVSGINDPKKENREPSGETISFSLSKTF